MLLHGQQGWTYVILHELNLGTDQWQVHCLLGTINWAPYTAALLVGAIIACFPEEGIVLTGRDGYFGIVPSQFKIVALASAEEIYNGASGERG